jgi:hypothetical protein
MQATSAGRRHNALPALIGIEFLRPRQFLGFGNSGDE